MSQTVINKNAYKLTVADFKGVGAVITDPPYGNNLVSNCKRGVNDRKAVYHISGNENQDAGNYVLSLVRQASVPIIIFFASPWSPWPGKFRNLVVMG